MNPIPWSIWPFPGSPFILPQFLEYQYLATGDSFDSFRATAVVFPVQLGGEIVPSRIVRSMLGGTRRSVAFVSSVWPSVPQAIVLPSATILSAKMFHRNGDCRHFAELHLEIESGKALLWRRSMDEGTLALLREHNPRGFASGGVHAWPTCSDIRALRRAFGPMRLVKSDADLDEYDLEVT